MINGVAPRSAGASRAPENRDAGAGEFIELCAIDSIPVRGSRVVRIPGGRIALFRDAKDEVFALDDRCPHAGGPLSQGIVHGKAVTCPLHNWVISLETGTVLGADKGQVQTVPLRVQGRTISVRLADLPDRHVRPADGSPIPAQPRDPVPGSSAGKHNPE